MALRQPEQRDEFPQERRVRARGLMKKTDSLNVPFPRSACWSAFSSGSRRFAAYGVTRYSQTGQICSGS